MWNGVDGFDETKAWSSGELLGKGSWIVVIDAGEEGRMGVREKERDWD